MLSISSYFSHWSRVSITDSDGLPWSQLNPFQICNRRSSSDCEPGDALSSGAAP